MMNTVKRVLVTYASRTRSTQSIADVIAEVLVKRGADVDMRFILDISDITPYDAVVIGSSIRTGHWLPEAIRFIKIHHEQLQKKSVAYFVVCMTLYQNTPENREKILLALEPVCQLVKPVDIGLFGGILERKKLKLGWRILSLFTGFPEGDFRDFPTIRSWSAQLAEKL
jgi:menaquinone-dependent protoporphyrinogen oxidase